MQYQTLVKYHSHNILTHPFALLPRSKPPSQQGTWVSPKLLPKSIGDYDVLFDELYSEYTISERMGIYATYRPENYFNGSYAASFIQLQGDSNVICPSLELANLTRKALQANKAGNVYFYQFGACV